MESEGFFYLGKILKPFGSKGHVLVLLDVDDPGKYETLESLFVEISGDRIPFFIESFELKEDRKALVKFEDVTSPEEAEPLTGKELYLPMPVLEPLKGRQFYYHEIEGFRVIDEVHGELGILDSIMEMPLNSLLRILKGNKEILVPLQDEILKKIDRRKKILHIRAPEGLIELYL